jgi:hypothetical protein
MCCGKYKQIEEKSDFILAAPFQYLNVCLVGGITPSATYLNLQQDKLSLREFATSTEILQKFTVLRLYFREIQIIPHTV